LRALTAASPITNWCARSHMPTAANCESEDQEQQLWSECSRLLANCIIYYNACILSGLLERAERRQDYQRADAIKRANPASWKHVNLYGAYSFLDIGDGVDLRELVNLLEAARGRGAAAPD
jgi:hypothetical protein